MQRALRVQSQRCGKAFFSLALIEAGAAERRYSAAEGTSGRTARKHKRRQIQAVSGAKSGNPKG